MRGSKARTPDDWDRQMQADAVSGRLDALAREAEDDYRKREAKSSP
jgi:hypothetical protein